MMHYTFGAKLCFIGEESLSLKLIHSHLKKVSLLKIVESRDNMGGGIHLLFLPLVLSSSSSSSFRDFSWILIVWLEKN